MEQTLEILRVGWPIILALIALTGFAIRVDSMAKQNRSDNEKTNRRLDDFLDRIYPRDKDGLLAAIENVRVEQKKSEEKLEVKLDAMADRSEEKIDRLHSEVMTVKMLLAEFKGLLQNRNGQTKNADV